MQPEVNPKNLGVKMLRRDFWKVALGAIASSALLRAAKGTNVTPAAEFPKTPGLTDYVGRFVVNTTYEDIPADVIELGKKSILDGLGLALAGSRAQTGTICRQYLEDDLSICGGKAIVIGSALKTSPRFAAFVNGVSIHADDFDDTQLSAAKDRVYGLLVHPTVPVLPAVLALSERRKISGKELMLSYHVGVEVECKIAEAISPRHYQDGFHSTGTCGVFGSAAACARLRGFDVAGTVRTFGIAGSNACGVRENFGTMMKPFHAGHSAETGIMATDFAVLDWTSTDQLLATPNGFLHAYGCTYDPAFILHKLGNPWTFASPGISIKPFPSGS